ncbi:MAG: HAD-IA family hydrolase [Nibricoccus sp.]
MPSTQAAIFDFDGTIADSFDELAEVYDQVAIDLGLRRLSRAEFESFRNMGSLEVMRAANVPLRKIPRLVSAMRAGMRERTKKLLPFDGISDVLRSLQAQDCRCGILSSNSLENVQCFLRVHGLSMFDLFSCGTSFLGKATRLRKINRQLALPPKNIFYIGDEVRDVTAANEVGIQSIGVCWGLASREALVAARATHIAERPEDLADLILSSRASLA